MMGTSYVLCKFVMDRCVNVEANQDISALPKKKIIIFNHISLSYERRGEKDFMIT